MATVSLYSVFGMIAQTPRDSLSVALKSVVSCLGDLGIVLSDIGLCF